MASLVNSNTKLFQEEIIPTLHRLLEKIEEDSILPDHFYRANISLTPKADKDIPQKDYRPPLVMNIDSASTKHEPGRSSGTHRG